MSEPLQTVEDVTGNEGGDAEEKNSHDKLNAVRYDPDFMQKLVKAGETLEEIEAQRKQLNAKTQEVFASLDQYGMNRHAIRDAIKYMGMGEKKRDNYDLSYLIFRQAHGEAVQTDLFEEKAKAEVRQFQKQKAAEGNQ